MKNLFKLSALTLFVATTSAYAHHPAEDMIDPEVYDMIEENISDVHLSMTFDDMGGNSGDVDTASGGSDETGSMSADMGSDLEDIGSDFESGSGMSAMADVEPAGQMGSQR